MKLAASIVHNAVWTSSVGRVHTDRHAHPSDLSDVSLLDQVTYIAGARGETALQPDDVSDAFRLSQSQKFLRLGGAGRKRPLAVDVLPAGDGCSS